MSKKNACTIKKTILLIALFSVALPLASCMHGGRASLKFKKMEYPASMSSYLYDKNWKKLQYGNQLQFIKKVTVTRKVWGMGYSMISFSKTESFDQKLNAEIKKMGGVGIVNVSVSTRGCSFNGVFPPLAILPLPGCGVVTVEGDIVKLK